MTPRALLLDALGTLLELTPPAPRLQSELERRYGVTVTEQEARAALRAEIAYYRLHLHEGRDPVSLAALRERCAAELHRALPDAVRAQLPPPSHLVDPLLAALHFEPFPDVAPALKAYRRCGLRLVVVSNWDVSLHVVLANVGLSPLLDGILTAAEAGSSKPAPAIFVQALRLARVVPSEAIHVGDSVEEDVAGARAAGIEPVLVDRTGSARVVDGVRTVAGLDRALF